MNTKLVSAIAFKLFAIYAVFSAIITIPSIAGFFIAIKRQAYGFEATIFWPVVISLITIIVTFIAFKPTPKTGAV